MDFVVCRRKDSNVCFSDFSVVDFILRGVDSGIGARRTRQANKDKDQVNTVRHVLLIK